MEKFFISIIVLISFISAQAQRLTAYVNPFIGTGAVENSLSGNTYPGATMPFGMVQLSPDTRETPDWDAASGYDYNDKTIYGFSHTRLSGTGACDLIDVLLMPTTQTANGRPTSSFSHADEKARPGYYAVVLSNDSVLAELSATVRVGLHRYTFPAGKEQRVFLDMDHSAPKGSWNRRIIQSQIRVVSSTVVEGYRVITGWAKLRRVYFRMELSHPISSHVIFDGRQEYTRASVVNGTALKAFFNFGSSGRKPLLVKVAISPVSLDGARMNMREEAPSWDFDSYASRAEQIWEQRLEGIEVDGTEADKQVFYTALYHTLIQPNTMSDVDGSYVSTDYSTSKMPTGVTYHSTFSLWDTYRAAHPLYAFIAPERNAQFADNMLRHYQSYGYLPIWDLWGQDNYCMIGNHAVPIVVDAWFKGQIHGFTADQVLEAVVNSCTTSHPGSNFEAWEKYGYVPENVLSQSVSITLEQSFDDWCVAQLAKSLGREEIYQSFIRRSGNFRNLYNPQTGFFQARNDKGQWLEPFDPLRYGANGGNPYTEGNAWQYLWYVPHDVPSLISLMGGKKNFIKRLDTFFTLNDHSGAKNDNASGFIGQYVHGNEPSHHVAYLYDYVGEPRKTQKLVN